jgi:PAS domain S-box-containing protein
MDPTLLLKALHGAAAGVMITDREGAIQWINAEFSRMTGYSSEDVVGHNTRILNSGIHDQSLFGDLWRTILSGLAWHGEMVNRRKDGSLYTEEQSITPVFNERQEVTQFICIKRDITARKRMEAELRESKERYQTLIECLGEGIVSMDRQRRILMANPAAENIFGVPRGAAVGKDVRDFADPGDLHLLRSEAERRERGEEGTFDLRVIRADGERRTLQVTATPQYDTSRQFQNILWVIRDITEEKRRLRTLRLLAHTLESVDECVSICDPGDRLLFVNRAFLRTYGYEECNLIGESIGIIRSPLNSPEVTGEILPATLAGGWRGELWNRKRDGTDFPVMLNTAAVIDGNGNIEATVGVARDITERKRAEAELTRARDHAESANRAKSEFLAMMSHEIRTPMNGVIGMTGLLLDTDLTPLQHEFADTARRSGEALLTLINDILDFSRIEAGKLEIECYPFDLCEVVEDVNELLASKARDKTSDLSLHYPPRTPRRFLGDGSRIRQIMTNLVGNAVKFTSNGSVLTSIQCDGQEAEHAQMRISVRDSGIGIAQESIGRLFEKFSQVDSSSTRKFSGTGLGLAISKQLVNLMGGSIGVESCLGEGSTFWFKLPLRMDTERLVLAPSSADIHGVRALIVDDNEVNRRVLDEQITGWGMRDGSAAGGAEALEAIRAAQRSGDPYQFVFLDYVMPEMDGIMLARAIRNDPSLHDTAIVMLTSLGQAPEISQAEGNIIDACLTKPVRQSQLFNTVVSIWTKRLGVNVADGIPPKPGNGAAKPDLLRSFTSCRVRVMIAEDNIVNQKVASRMVERLGLRADVAANGLEAVAMFELLPYDLILMDCQMPEMDGYEATAKIRQLKASPRRVVIIAMTAEAMAGTRERCLEAGMDDYISKPVKLEELRTILGKWLLFQQPGVNKP